jgi:hypothetical protein
MISLPTRVLIASIVGYLVAAFACSWSHAAPPPGADPALASWFNALTNPATGLSCCREFDGHVLADRDWRVAGDHYEIRIAGQWRAVPAPAVLDRVDNPTGGAVAFYARAADGDPAVAPLIYCFVRPVET